MILDKLTNKVDNLTNNLSIVSNKVNILSSNLDISTNNLNKLTKIVKDGFTNVNHMIDNIVKANNLKE